MVADLADRAARKAALSTSWTTSGTIWYTTAGTCDYEPPKPEPLPFFLDPEQIAALTPEINWSDRVGDRIRQFLDWGAELGAAEVAKRWRMAA